MIAQDTIEKYISYAQELVRRIKSRQKIDSSQMVIHKTGRTSGWDISFYSAEGEYKEELWRATFNPTHGGTPYTEFDIYAFSNTNAVYYNYDDNSSSGSLSTVIYISAKYLPDDMYIRINARSLDTGTLTFQKI